MSIPVLIIPVLNRFDLLEKTLQSIDHPIDNVLIIDNSGTDYKVETTGLNLKVLNMPSNQGVAGSWNMGIKAYPFAPYWLIGSADTHFMPGALKLFEELSGPDKFVQSSAFWSAFSIGEDIVGKVGLFDEFFYPAYWEDNNYQSRMERMGMRYFFEDDSDNPKPVPSVNDNGGSRTINSNEKFLKNNNETTFGPNRTFYKYQVENDDFSIRGWELKRRRDHEWNL